MTSEPVDTIPGSASPVILIAEDDEGHASLLERNLRRCGITQICHRFRDGQEVLDFLLKVSKSTPPDTPKSPHPVFGWSHAKVEWTGSPKTNTKPTCLECSTLDHCHDH